MYNSSVAFLEIELEAKPIYGGLIIWPFLGVCIPACGIGPRNGMFSIKSLFMVGFGRGSTASAWIEIWRNLYHFSLSD